ncbi:MAG: ketoacyl-ACP synthase III [Clostridia bacterium]|nr:ketoacyl-ACP synthase III [Clostridia bacterium]MBQ3553729.1 ketoacyl-ACP synthase III [Clostridia bacterium]
MNAKIAGVGMYLPEKVLTNFDLEKMVDTSDEWITKRTGIKERHIAREDEFASDMAVIAAKEAIEDAGLSAEDIDLILVSSVSSEMITPTIACLVQKQIGATKAAAIDMNSACTGFVSAMIIAQQFIKSGTYQNILVIGTDTMTKYTDWEDRASCVLFGDGAGAAVVTPCPDGDGILAFDMGADGTKSDVLSIPHLKFSEEDLARRGGEKKRTFWMDGSEVFKFAVRVMCEAMNCALDKAGMTVSDLDLIVPHQANIRIVDGAVKRLGIDPEKVFVNIQKTGNMSSACVPLALCEAIREGKAKQGDTIGLVGFGGGLTWASLIMKI